MMIFRDLDLGRVAPFDYVLDYVVREHSVQVVGTVGRRPTVVVDGVHGPAARLRDEARELLPSTVFVYYSGRSARMERLFRPHERRYTKRMESSGEEYLPEELLTEDMGEFERSAAIEQHMRRVDRRRSDLGEGEMRRLFFCRPDYSQLVLLSCFLANDSIFTRLLRDLGIRDLDSALFVLTQPHRLRRRLTEREQADGDPRFWYARGEVVENFLDKLWDVAMAPIRHEVTRDLDVRGRSEKQEQLYLFVDGRRQLLKLGELVGGPERFFRYAEAAYIADLLSEVRVNVHHDSSGRALAFDHLSEGELQLLTVIGLMRLSGSDHCLFLLDEPDTHLNPMWKLRYFEEIEQVAQGNAESLFAGNSHVIITTHDPMMIGSLRREEVSILRKTTDRSEVETPLEHPQGMGIAGLLKSDMFGLASTLDAPTLRKLDERNALIAKRSLEGLDGTEQERLVRLQNSLDDLGFAREYRDPLYQKFIEEMYRARRKPLTELFSNDELQEQTQLANQIVEKIVKQEKRGQLEDLVHEVGQVSEEG
jgi:hypothetical protein